MVSFSILVLVEYEVRKGLQLLHDAVHARDQLIRAEVSLFLLELLLAAGLMHDVEGVESVLLVVSLFADGPAERATLLSDLQGLLSVSLLLPCRRVVALRFCDDGNQQVQHEDNHEEDCEEEDQPVEVAEVDQLVVDIKVAYA